MVPTSSPTERPAVADLTVLTTLINNFLKRKLYDIWSLALVPIQESKPIQPIDMETEADTATSNHNLTDNPEKTTANDVTTINVARPTPALNPSIYLTTPVVLPSPLMIATVAAARYSVERPGCRSQRVQFHATAAQYAVLQNTTGPTTGYIRIPN
uniref:Uncharacterized protein n=1 Tax=Romanomermis culicivorax TaxID=13658 RepID=A0A915L8D6_ROMCU